MATTQMLLAGWYPPPIMGGTHPLAITWYTWGDYGRYTLARLLTLGRLESRLPARYRRDVRIAQKRFYFDPTPWWEGAPVLDHLHTLRQGVWHSRKVALEYENAAGKKSSRIVRPYGLVVKTTHWYLVAYCEVRKEIRAFSIYRIASARLLEETFAWPEGFSLEAYWKARVREFTSEVAEREQHLRAQR